jgi:formylmethanofuran dehydrogenase subunit D
MVKKKTTQTQNPNTWFMRMAPWAKGLLGDI